MFLKYALFYIRPCTCNSGFEKRQAEVIVSALVTLTTANMDIVYRDMVTGAHQVND